MLQGLDFTQTTSRGREIINMIPKLFIVLLVVCNAVVINSQQCTTPNNTPGECISLLNCYILYQAFWSIPIPPDTKEFIKRSACGLENNVPKVCCGEEATWAEKPTVSVASTSTTFPRISTGARSSLLPKSPDCGLSLTDRIYGGNITALDEFPWLALLEYKTARNQLRLSCGGALINDRYVLTAAHCVTGIITRQVGKLEYVRLGEFDTTTDPDCVILPGTNEQECADPVQRIPVESSIHHPQFVYTDKKSENDIALVRLAAPARTSDFIKFLCLPTPEIMPSVGGDKLFISGWGETQTSLSSNVKLKVDVPVIDFARCKYQFDNIYKLPLGNGHLCAGGESEKDACLGDSGGPLMKLIGSIWYSEGVVSYGLGCGIQGRPGVYTRVSYYMDWITENVRP